MDQIKEHSVKKEFVGQMISEAAAMFIIIAFGDSAAAMYTLYTPSPYQQAYWGVWHRVGARCHYRNLHYRFRQRMPCKSGGYSGVGDLSEVFLEKSIALLVRPSGRRFFVGAAVVYLLFSPVIDQFNLTNHFVRSSGGAAGVFFTRPGFAITPMHAFMDEIILTGFQIFGIFAVTEQFNEMASGANAGALIIGLLVALIGASMGYLEAWALNPARDFGSRLFCFFTGWRSSALPSPDSYWWIPIAAPLIGAVVGGAYQLLIWPFLPARDRALLKESERLASTTDLS